MAICEWRSEYSVGDDIIDRQHQDIIDIINELHQLLSVGDVSESDAGHIFDRLAMYVAKHFIYEEQRMVEGGCPDEQVMEHKRTHNQLLRKIQEIVKAYETGDHDVLKDLLPYLYGEWLLDHICHTDKKYMPYLK